MKLKGLLIALAMGLAIVGTGADAGTLEDVKAKGFLTCGISEGVQGFFNLWYKRGCPRFFHS
jgi:general L-amino acid transport system substrate-binding protein